ncbi:MAG: Hsp70 family protein [Pseudobacteriovorax sp.]|nr:Hsp70 family protein [Pseudobacteriovorax sp.]
MNSSQSYIGIDLGTSNSAVALATKNQGIKTIDIDQWVGSSEKLSCSTLPSAILITSDGALKVGAHAREQSVDQPSNTILSAKSWLCLDSIDRQKPILPWQSTSEHKLSPLQATKEILTALMEGSLDKITWETTPIVLTVPASFDEVARKLTQKAAYESGLTSLTLLEEPLAALYSWLSKNQSNWRDELAVGDLVFVCDVGGGTTDFSLVSITENQGELALERIAVGPHLLLGGDNMDLTLAHYLSEEQSEKGEELDEWQFQSLIHAVRQAKEHLLNSEDQDYQISVASRSSDIFASAISFTIRKDWLLETLVCGFFPKATIDDIPDESNSVIADFGLPYANDPVISRHIVKFLRDAAGSNHDLSSYQQGENKVLSPSHILFNGGTMQPKEFQEAILATINQFSEEPVKVLNNDNLNLAVAHGAAYYSELKASGEGVKILAATSHSYYLEIQSSRMPIPGKKPEKNAVCLVPVGTEQGQTLVLKDRTFALKTGEKVQFKFYESGSRTKDTLGTVVKRPELTLDSQFPVQTTIESEEKGALVPVSLKAHVSEVGTLDLSLTSLDESSTWNLALDIES